MSRSTSIWLVFDDTAAVLAAFTVRHEMVDWVQHQARHGEAVERWTANRMPDNPDRASFRPEQLDLQALLRNSTPTPSKRLPASAGCPRCYRLQETQP